MSFSVIKVKEENEQKFSEQCRACLSIGRRMVPSGEFLNTYRYLTAEYDLLAPKVTEPLLLCWECHSLLSKVQRFQRQVWKANEMLKLGQGFFCSLSNLATVIINGDQSNAVYVFEQSPAKDMEKNVNSTHDGFLKSDGKSDVVFTECNVIDGNKEMMNKSNVEVGGDNNVNNAEKIFNNKTNKRINKWAVKRALLNKKPKFKLITDRKLHIDKIFSKVQLDDVQMRKFFNEKRESTGYRLKTFKCEKCVIGFINGEMLLKHFKRFHKENVGSYICDICNRNFPDKFKLSTHIQSHYCLHKCRSCSYICQDKKSRWKHVEKVHTKVLQCLKCELVFGSRREFFKHHKEWHQKFVCDKCGISFKMRYCIKDHIRKQHSPFECKPCGKLFARYNGLWLHNKLRHSGPAPPAYCVECDRRYPDGYRYRWHLANSARHRPRKKIRIPCPECEKVFSKNIYMKDHYNLVHLKNFKYRCEVCNKNFVRNADLKKHNRRVHEGVLPPKDKICYVCGRGFTTNKILANHLRTHTGERPYACTQCPSRFGQSAALASHIRSLHAL